MIKNNEDLKERHDTAMNISELALDAKRNGQYGDFLNLSYQAFLLEEQCAFYAYNKNIDQPLKSILFRSCATLAIDCKIYASAITMAEMGLEGNTPDEIKQEVVEVLYKAL